VRNGTKIQPNPNKIDYGQHELLFDGSCPQFTFLPALAAKENSPFCWNLGHLTLTVCGFTLVWVTTLLLKTHSDSSHNKFNVSFNFSTGLNVLLSWEKQMCIINMSILGGSQGPNKALNNPLRSQSWRYFQPEVGLETSWGPFQPELSLKMNGYNGFFFPIKYHYLLYYLSRNQKIKMNVAGVLGKEPLFRWNRIIKATTTALPTLYSHHALL